MNSENEMPSLRQIWEEADKKARIWSEEGELKLLLRMHAAFSGLKSIGWQEASYCPKDGTLFLAIEAGSVGVFPCRYRGDWPTGTWWLEAHGDLWPSRPVLWKPMPDESKDQS